MKSLNVKQLESLSAGYVVCTQGSDGPVMVFANAGELLAWRVQNRDVFLYGCHFG